MSILNFFVRKTLNAINASIHPRAEDVELVSYHIPKTAGTSFGLTLNSLYGTNGVYKAYDAHECRLLSNGMIQWIPKGTKVVHGHFFAHARHKKLFPSAKRIIWLRDPIKRAWSEFNHHLNQNTEHKITNYCKQNFSEQLIDERETLFLEILKHDEVLNLFKIYSRNLNKVNPPFFDFVGISDHYNDELSRLAKVLNCKPLPQHQVNRAVKTLKLPDLPDKLRAKFDSEYEIFKRFTKAKR